MTHPRTPGRHHRLRCAVPIMLIVWMLVMTGPVKAGDGHAGDVDGAVEWSPVPTTPEGGGHFTENLGQWDAQARFIARSPFGHAVLARDGVVYDVVSPGGGHRVKLAFDAEAPVDPVGVGDMGFPTNYLIGDRPDAWVTGARSYMEVVYSNVWPGVDVRYHFSGGALKYDLLLDEGADPSLIRFRVEGSEGLRVGSDGLRIGLPGGASLQDRDLVAWYGNGEPVDVGFAVDGDGYGFRVDKEEGRSMVIDPIVMHASSYLGGTYLEEAVDMVVDGEDKVIIVGWTTSTDFPVTTGAYDTEMDSEDVLVSKMNHNCSRVIWATYLGGTRADFPNTVTVDDRNDIYIAGNTWSGNFPVTDGAYCEDMNLGTGQYNIDIFVTKMTSRGDSVEHSTFIGGTTAEVPYDIKVVNGVVALGGMTISADFPTTTGFHNSNFGAAYIMTLDDELGRMESCWIWDGIGSESVTSLTFDENGDIALGGITSSPGFPTTPGVYQPTPPPGFNSFVARYSPTKNMLLFCTYLGGGSRVDISAMTVDDDMNVYLAGSAQGWAAAAFPTSEWAYDRQHNGTWDGFVAKMDPNGTRLIYSSLLGGDGDDFVRDMDLDDDGNVAVVGTTDSGEGFTMTPDAHDTVFAGEGEGFIVILDDDASDAVYSSFHGGSHDDEVISVRMDAVDNYVVAGSTESSDLPVRPDGYQTRYAGYKDMFVSVIGELSPPSAPLSLVAEGKEGSIDLDWMHPADNGGYRVREYHLFRGSSEDDLGLYEVLGSVHGYSDDDVEWGHVYHYAVYASNWKGMSPRSNVASARSVTVPDPPVNMTAVVGMDGVSMEWATPRFTGGLPLTGYNIYRTAEGGSRELLVTNGPDGLTFEDMDAEDGTVYTYYVTAVNEHGESRRDANATVLTTAVPSPPVDLGHTYGELFIRLTWERPVSDFGLPVLEYTVHRSTFDGPSEAIEVVPAPDRAFSDTDVVLGTLYTYRVTARNAKGTSDPSEALEARVMVRPDPPTGVRAVATDSFVRITWAPPSFDGASPLLGYRVYLDRPGEDPLCLGGKDAPGAADGHLVFLHDVPYDGLVRTYLVTAVNGEGESDFSAPASTIVYVPPGAPGDLGIEWGDGRLTLGWQGPSYDGGTPVLSFAVYRQAAGEAGPSLLVTLPPGGLGYMDDTTLNGVAYTYHVTATNMVGEGGPSARVSATPAGLPGAPRDVSGEGLDGSARISWAPPADSGGRPVTGYRVYAVTGGTGVDLRAEVGADAREWVHEGLTNGGVYVYAVTAVTEVGVSPLSDAVEARPVGPPSSPRELGAKWMANHVVLTWDRPLEDGGSAILGYRILRDGWDGAGWVSVSGPPFRDLDAVPGTTYNYTVLAFSAAGDGPVAELSFTVPPEEMPEVEVETIGWSYMALVALLVAVVIAAVVVARGQRNGPEAGGSG